MISRINYKLLGVISFAVIAVILAAGVQLLQPTVAEAINIQAAPVEQPFKLMKSISDNYTPDPFTADEFKFHVTGNGVDMMVDLTAHTNDTAEKVINLLPGTYTIEEVGPAGFVPADWTVQWSGFGCKSDPNDTPYYNGNGPVRPIHILVQEVTDPDAGGNVCKADNQWRPLDDGDDDDDDVPGCTNPLATNYNPLATVDNGSCVFDNGGGNGGGTGVLVVNKVVINDQGGLSTANNFSFKVNDGVSTAFEADGTNVMTLATGTYSVTESPAPTGYAVSYSGCANIAITAGATSTCTITNNDILGGDGGNDHDTFMIQGYVWHDKNANDLWEMEGSDVEPDLDGWTVTITNGSSTQTTTTDATGKYFFVVPAGTWTITETLQADWNQTFPNSVSHVVTVPGAPVVTVAEDENIFALVLNFLIPTAQAATIATYGDYNFGNVYVGGTGGCGSDCGNGGGGGGGGHHGSKKPGGTGGGSDEPGEVLGDATTAMPIGAPNTGAGGTSSPMIPVLPHILAVATARVTGRVKNG